MLDFNRIKVSIDNKEVVNLDLDEQGFSSSGEDELFTGENDGNFGLNNVFLSHILYQNPLNRHSDVPSRLIVKMI
jgi:hypothetical protein